MTAHTPAPWKVATAEITSEHGSIALVAIGREEYAANLRLIAAAPELLAACQAALAFITAGGQGAPPLDVLRAALTAAKP